NHIGHPKWNGFLKVPQQGAAGQKLFKSWRDKKSAEKWNTPRIRQKLPAVEIRGHKSSQRNGKAYPAAPRKNAFPICQIESLFKRPSGEATKPKSWQYPNQCLCCCPPCETTRTDREARKSFINDGNLEHPRQ